MFNKNTFKKRILFVGIPDMAYIGLDGLLMAGVNIVGVLGPKKDHNMYYDFRNFVLSRRLNFIEYDELDEIQLIKKIQDGTVSYNSDAIKSWNNHRDAIVTAGDALLEVAKNNAKT